MFIFILAFFKVWNFLCSVLLTFVFLFVVFHISLSITLAFCLIFRLLFGLLHSQCVTTSWSIATNQSKLPICGQNICDSQWKICPYDLEAIFSFFFSFFNAINVLTMYIKIHDNNSICFQNIVIICYFGMYTWQLYWIIWLF